MNMKKISALIGSVVLSATIISAHADDNESANIQAEGVKLIQSLTNGKAKISDSFKTNVGLDGYVIEPVEAGGKKQVVFTQGGQYLIIGNVVTAEGENLTEKYTNKLITSQVAEESYQAIGKLNWIAEGSDKAKHKLYVILDPNCIYCHLFYKEVNKLDLIKNGDLQIRWLPVGFLKPSSAGMAAAMFNSKSPVQAIVKDENAFNDKSEEGGLKPLDKSSTNEKVIAAFAKVNANTKFFSKYGFGGTPTLIYKQADGEYGFIPGFLKGEQLTNLVNSLSATW